MCREKLCQSGRINQEVDAGNLRQAPIEDDDVGIDGGIERTKQRGVVAEMRLFQIASFGGKDALHWKTTLIGRHAANKAAN